MAIKIFADSTCDIPKELTEKYDITIVPLSITLNGETYMDWYDLSHEEFMDKLISCDELPKTSQATPARFIEYYKKDVELGNTILSFHITSKISGTYQSAVIASQSFENSDITVINTKNLSMGFGMLVLEAAKMAQAGSAKEEILQRVNYLIPRIHCSFHVDTLDYLKKGGRISNVQATITNVLNIKPIITMLDGEIIITDKVRGKKKVISTFLDAVRESYDPTVMKEVCICCDKIDEEALGYKEKLEEITGKDTVFLSQYGSVISTYCGPGTTSIIFTHTNPIV